MEQQELEFEEGSRVVDTRKCFNKGHGVIVGCEGSGRKRKWIVDFDDGSKNVAMQQRSLRVVGTLSQLQYSSPHQIQIK